MTIRRIAALAASLFSISLFAAEPSTGPIIADYGRSALVEDADFQLPADHEYRVVWEITGYGDGPDGVNRNIDRVARFLNLHAKAGVPKDKMHLAFVVHGAALQSMINDAAYRELHGMPNPTGELLERLGEAGVEMYVCGQSMAFRGWGKDMLASPVKLAPSAMSIMNIYQSRGYTRQ
jgi:intracellular sulfur oxidation DsrE/DsrF family protein